MRSDALYLADIRDAIEAIERFVTDFDEVRFLSDELVRRRSAGTETVCWRASEAMKVGAGGTAAIGHEETITGKTGRAGSGRFEPFRPVVSQRSAGSVAHL